MKANECMAAALKTYEERGKQYGDSYIRHGLVMRALFPNDVILKTEEDWQRFGVLNMIVSKLVRYTMNWKAPHVDSIHDMGVYCFIEEELARAHHDIKKLMQDVATNNLKEYESLHPAKPKDYYFKPIKETIIDKPYHGIIKPKVKK